MSATKRAFPESRVLYEDNHLLVVNKLPGELVQGDKTGDKSLLDVLKQYLKEKHNKPGNVFLGLPHRLDRPTSGIVVFAKTSKALSRLSEQFKNRANKKVYWAVVNKPIRLKQAVLEDHLRKNEHQNKSYVVKSSEPGAKKAKLSYEVVAEIDRYFMLEVLLETGRHHQIRTQLARRDMPIKGDLKYGYSRSNQDASIHLHARYLEFEHPVTKELKKFKAKAPREKVWTLLSEAYSKT
jgi:23S rRNA pseudouridine1911/1915/1917 synthase